MNIRNILYTLLTACILYGCQDDELVSYNHGGLRVIASFTETRLAHSESENINYSIWEENDQIGLFTDKQGNLPYYAISTGRFTEFSPLAQQNKLEIEDGTKVYAYYPYTEDTKDNMVLIAPIATQEYSDSITNDFLYAEGTVQDNVLSLKFKHVFAYLKITLSTDILKGALGIKIQSKEYIGGRPYEPNYFNPISQEIIKNETNNPDLDILYNDWVNYSIPEDTINNRKSITCYVAIYPQSGHSVITIKTYGLDNITDHTLLTKRAPEGGFQAGNIYTLSINEDNNAEILAREREALIAFYNAMDGDNWTRNDNWCSDKPVSEWYGVTLWPGDDRVRGLSLGANNLSGTLPPELTQLEELNDIFLPSNDIYGEIPENYIDFPLLVEFNVAKHQFDTNLRKMTGEVPDFASHCPYLRELYLNYNAFTGSLPESHKDGISIETVGNQFTGTIPESYAYIMDAGRYLKISDNNLSGKIPDAISKHPNFHVYWWDMLFQNDGYVFDKVDIPSHTNTVKCYDGSFVNLGEEYKKNKYTMFFTWSPQTNETSTLLMRAVSHLYDKYKDQGLGVIGMTTMKYKDEEITTQLACMPNMKHFWGAMAGNAGAQDETYDNYPWSSMTNGFYLFRQPFDPFFHIVDNQGNIIYWGYGYECAYQNDNSYPFNNENIFRFTGALFGNPNEDGSFEDEDFDVDYSRDGEVVQLQSASIGNGVDLVFMGDFFTDKEMDSYDWKMIQAMEQLFAIEPYSSLRDRFNVYSVKVVSKANFISALNEDNAKCFEYASKVPGIDMDKLMVTVVYNTSYNSGRSYTTMYSDGSFVAYIMQNIDGVLNHETGGHGIAKLSDEYVEAGYWNETLPESEKETMDNQWENFGWGANVDWRNDPTTVRWSRFLQDSRYDNEGLGLYEGAYLYGYGAYRPTENSMMRYNDSPFNAPSREQIYKTVMQMSEGSSWTYDYEEFVQFDAVSRNTAVSRSLRQQPSAAQVEKWKKTHRPPVRVKGTWRDAKKNHIVVPYR